MSINTRTDVCIHKYKYSFSSKYNESYSRYTGKEYNYTYQGIFTQT